MTKPAPIKIRGVHHFAMSVPSLESAIAFYRDAFGFELVDHEHLGQSEEGDRVTQMKNTDTTLAMLHAGNIFIELFEFHSPQPGENTRRMCDYGVTHFSFEVEDVYTSHEALKAHCVQWHSDPIDAGDGYLMTYGRDPFGNVIEIQQVPNERAYAFAQPRGE